MTSIQRNPNAPSPARLDRCDGDPATTAATTATTTATTGSSAAEPEPQRPIDPAAQERAAARMRMSAAGGGLRAKLEGALADDNEGPTYVGKPKTTPLRGGGTKTDYMGPTGHGCFTRIQTKDHETRIARDMMGREDGTWTKKSDGTTTIKLPDGAAMTKDAAGHISGKNSFGDPATKEDWDSAAAKFALPHKMPVAG